MKFLDFLPNKQNLELVSEKTRAAGTISKKLTYFFKKIMNELKICLIRVWFKTAFSYFYKEQKKVTRKGTEKSTQKPWKMETMMKLSPE